jgi:hypothetical protein
MIFPLFFQCLSHNVWSTEGSSGLASTVHWNSSKIIMRFLLLFHLFTIVVNAFSHPDTDKPSSKGSFKIIEDSFKNSLI